MFGDLSSLLDSLAGELAPIQRAAARLLDETSVLDDATGNALISRRTKIAPEAFAFVLFRGISSENIGVYTSLNKRISIIPHKYREILAVLNGASLFQIHLYGIPLSMCSDPPLLNRSTRQPLDLGSANANWSREFCPSLEQFHFGGGPYSESENLGYFLNADNSVEALRRGGAGFGTWPDFASFLKDELERAEALFPEREERWFKFNQSLGPRVRRSIKKPN
jgi:hypothetical protein